MLDDIMTQVAILLLGALVWSRHRANIGRLLTGKETKIGTKQHIKDTIDFWPLLLKILLFHIGIWYLQKNRIGIRENGNAHHFGQWPLLAR